MDIGNQKDRPEKGLAATTNEACHKDITYAGYHGFNLLEDQIRADYYFYGTAEEFAGAKAEMLRKKPRSCGDAAQVECYIAGIVRATGGFKDSVAIIHGPIGCGYNQFLIGDLFYMDVVCTQMTEEDALLGGEKKLKAAIEEVIETYRPGLICVVDTCTSSIIGDDSTGIAETLEAKSGIPIIAFGASGFKHKTWNLASDEAFNFIIDRMQAAEQHRPFSFNYLNFPVLALHWKEFYEITPYLTQLGLELNCHAPNGQTFQDFIHTFPLGSLNINRCPGNGLQSMEYAEKRLGMPYLALPRPISIRFTDHYIRKVAEFFGRQKEAETLIAEEKARYKDRWDAARARLEGKRIAISAGSAGNICYAQLAVEFDLKVVYLSPYTADPLYHYLLTDWLKHSGQNPELFCGSDLCEQEAVLARLKPDFYIGMPEECVSMRRLGVPSINFVGLSDPQEIGFEGAAQFAEQLINVMDNKLLPILNQHLEGGFPFYASADFIKTGISALKPCFP